MNALKFTQRICLIMSILFLAGIILKLFLPLMER